MTEQWLLTAEEMAQAYFASQNTPVLPSEAMCRAQLRKVAAWVKRSTMRVPSQTSERLGRVTYWSQEEWDALMKEAGLE